MKLLLTGLGELQLVPESSQTDYIQKGYTIAEVLACGVCRTDAKMWEQGHRDLVFPRVLGHEFVVRTDNGARFAVWPGKSCSACYFCSAGSENLCDEMKITGFHHDGGFASTALVPIESLIPLPEKLDYTIGCFAEPVGCVVNAFEKIAFSKNDRVLIYGAGTLGLITALYAGFLGLRPFLLEKNQQKITRVQPFLNATGIPCHKKTDESEFETVMSCCADFTAFCQAITKVKKGGNLSFFSGLSKNEHIETNLLNLLHYKEVNLNGVYGMTRDHMRKGLQFISEQVHLLTLLIEDCISLDSLQHYMPDILSGEHLKYIVDFSLSGNESKAFTESNKIPQTQGPQILATSTIDEVIHTIQPLKDILLSRAMATIDNKTKPLGALGRLEELAVQISCIQNSLTPMIRSKQLFVFAADHGITEEGVSAYPSEVTAQMVDNFLQGGAAINVLCRHHNIGMKVVDMGVNSDFLHHNDLIDKKVARGTGNFAREDAMTGNQMLTALENGMEVFLHADGEERIDIVGFGEMGIGNTTAASTIIAAITGISPSEAAGRGTGLDDEGLEHKIEVIDRVLQFHDLESATGYHILQKVGGFEIAGIAGAVLAAASRRCTIVLDGLISTAAGLIAYHINPHISGYLIAGHKSVEIGQKAALAHMGLRPLIDLDLRLGEGTGAALAIDMAEAACKIMTEMASFDEARVARSNSRQ